MRNDDIGAESDKFLGVLLGTIASRVGIAKLDLDVFTIRVAEGVQTAPECIGERMRSRRGHQHSNKGEFRGRCARAPSGHGVAIPPSSVMNSRRLMGIPCMRGSHTLPRHTPYHVVEEPCYASQHFGPPDFRKGQGQSWTRRFRPLGCLSLVPAIADLFDATRRSFRVVLRRETAQMPDQAHPLLFPRADIGSTAQM